MDIVEIKKVVGRIKSGLFKNSNSYSIGMLRSHFRGTGLQFKEHQIYSHGDEVRFIDWKILAKTGVPYVKTFDEERNVEIAVIIDASATMFSGYNQVSKLQAAIEVCCLLYLLAAETGDYVHATIVAGDIIYVPKKSGDAGIAALIAALSGCGLLKADGAVNLSYVPRRQLSSREKAAAIMKHLIKRRELVLLSDFNDFFDDAILRKVAYQRRVHCFCLMSPLDEAERTPYCLHCSDSFYSPNGQLGRINFAGQKDHIKLPDKKFKKLKVHQRYLEEFIKEML